MTGEQYIEADDELSCRFTFQQSSDWREDLRKTVCEFEGSSKKKANAEVEDEDEEDND